MFWMCRPETATGDSVFLCVVGKRNSRNRESAFTCRIYENLVQLLLYLCVFLGAGESGIPLWENGNVFMY